MINKIKKLSLEDKRKSIIWGNFDFRDLNIYHVNGHFSSLLSLNKMVNSYSNFVKCTECGLAEDYGKYYNNWTIARISLESKLEQDNSLDNRALTCYKCKHAPCFSIIPAHLVNYEFPLTQLIHSVVTERKKFARAFCDNYFSALPKERQIKQYRQTLTMCLLTPQDGAVNLEWEAISGENMRMSEQMRNWYYNKEYPFTLCLILLSTAFIENVLYHWHKMLNNDLRGIDNHREDVKRLGALECYKQMQKYVKERYVSHITIPLSNSKYYELLRFLFNKRNDIAHGYEMRETGIYAGDLAWTLAIKTANVYVKSILDIMAQK